MMEPFLREAISSGTIDPTKGLQIARLKDVQTQKTILATAIENDYNWRELKDAVDIAKKKEKGEEPAPPKPYVYNAFLPTKVKLSNLRDFVDSLDLDDDTESEIADLVDKTFTVLKNKGLLQS